MENSTGAELLRFLTADAETHEATIVLVIERGGLSRCGWQVCGAYVLNEEELAKGCCKTREEMVRIRARFQPCRNHGKESRGFSRSGRRG